LTVAEVFETFREPEKAPTVTGLGGRKSRI